MRIPIAEGLGNRIAPAEVHQVGDTGAAGIGAAVGRLANVAGDAANQQIAQLREDDLKRQRAQAALTLAEVSNQAHDAHDEVARGVADGTIDPTKAGPELSGRIAKLRDERFQNLNEDQRGAIADNLVNVQGSLMRNLNGVVIKRQQSDTGSTIDAFGEQKQRDAMRVGPATAASDYDTMIDFSGSAAGWSPEIQAKKKQAFREGVHYSFFDAAGTEALTRGDAAAVGAVLDKVKGPDGEAMDPVKRTQLTHQLFGYQQHILAQQAARQNGLDQDAERREKAAGDFYDQMTDIVMKGGVPSPDMIKLATGAAVGTGWQNSIGQLLANQREVAGFASLTAEQRQAQIATFQARRADPAIGTSPGTEKFLGKMVELNSKLTAEAKENPWGAARTAGVTSLPPLDASNLDSVMGGLKARLEQIGKVETWTGQKISPLEPAEAATFASFVGKLPPDQRSKALGQVGAMLDLKRLEALADQIDKQDKPMALAMKLGSDQSSSGRNVGELVLRGAQGLKDKVVKRDDAALSGWRAEISGLVRGTLGDQKAEDDAIDAAYFVRAAMDVDGINAPGFKLGQSAEKAVKLVLGQPMERGGVKTVLPKGFDEDMFDDKLKGFTPEVLKGFAPSGQVYVRGVPQPLERFSNALSGMGMKKDGRGNYVPSTGGAFVTVDKDGQVPLRLPIH